MLCNASSSPRLRRERRDVRAEMVASIRDLRLSQGSVTKEDLQREGFSSDEILTHGEAAVAEARRLDRLAAA